MQSVANRKRFLDVLFKDFRLKCRMVRKDRVRATLDRWDIPRKFSAWFVEESELIPNFGLTFQ
jgi:hypothetical protein